MGFNIHIGDISIKIDSSNIRDIEIGILDKKLVANVYMKTLKDFLNVQEKLSNRFISSNYTIHYDRVLYLIRITR